MLGVVVRLARICVLQQHLVDDRLVEFQGDDFLHGFETGDLDAVVEAA